MYNLIDTFFFNKEKFDFWEIYERILKFYPVGIPRDKFGFSQTFPGRKELETLIDDNSHNKKNFKTRWGSFDKEIKKHTGKKIIGTTYGQVPCFSSYIEIEKKKFKNITQFKEIHYFTSFLGDFYTVIGQNRNELKEHESTYWTTNYLVASPENEFADLFNCICEQIETKFKGFRFVPFSICTQKIIGLDVRDQLEKQDTIFSAIFNSQVNLNSRVLGDQFYKSGDWIKDGYVDNGSSWTIYPPDTLK